MNYPYKISFISLRQAIVLLFLNKKFVVNFIGFSVMNMCYYFNSNLFDLKHPPVFKVKTILFCHCNLSALLYQILYICSK